MAFRRTRINSNCFFLWVFTVAPRSGTLALIFYQKGSELLNSQDVPLSNCFKLFFSLLFLLKMECPPWSEIHSVLENSPFFLSRFRLLPIHLICLPSRLHHFQNKLGFYIKTSHVLCQNLMLFLLSKSSVQLFCDGCGYLRYLNPRSAAI